MAKRSKYKKTVTLVSTLTHCYPQTYPLFPFSRKTCSPTLLSQSISLVTADIYLLLLSLSSNLGLCVLTAALYRFNHCIQRQPSGTQGASPTGFAAVLYALLESHSGTCSLCKTFTRAVAPLRSRPTCWASRA